MEDQLSGPQRDDPDAILRDGAEVLGVELAAETRARLLDLGRRILEASRTVNLTGARDPATLVEDHILDSLTLVPLIRRRIEPAETRRPLLVDIGSGGGFPALPLAVVLEDLDALCIESVGKKARALADLAEAILPGRVTVLHDRAERVAHDPKWRETADWATARGVARLATACELALPFLRRGGVFFAQKGGDPQAEVEEAGHAISVLNARVDSLVRLAAAGRHCGRTIVAIEKTGPTPETFPRRPGLPAKRPLRPTKRN